jgi:hypothetical protein
MLDSGLSGGAYMLDANWGHNRRLGEPPTRRDVTVE